MFTGLSLIGFMVAHQKAGTVSSSFIVRELESTGQQSNSFEVIR